MENIETAEWQECERLHSEIENFFLINHLPLDRFNLSEEDIDKINSLFDELFNKSQDVDYFWKFCPLNGFKIPFEQAYQKFIRTKKAIPYFIRTQLNELFLDTERDERLPANFIEDWADCLNYSSLKDNEESYTFPFKYYDDGILMEYYFDYFSQDNLDWIESFQNEKIKYILDRFKETNKTTPVILNSEPEVYLDYSQNTGVEKIVFLHQLGIIDFLQNKQPFNMSTNKLAEVISAFTGIPQSTAQSYINPIISRNVVDRNNPLKEKTIATVRQKLTNMGYSE